MVAREYTRGARSAGLPGAPNNEETHPRPEPTPEPHAVRAVPEPATERLAVAGERSGPPSPSLPYQEMALVHQNQNQNPFDDPIGQKFRSPKKAFNPILGGGDLSLEAIARNFNFPADIHTTPPPVLT